MTKVLLHTDDPDTALSVLARTHPDLGPSICTDYEGLAAAVAAEAPEIVYSCRFLPSDFPREALIGASSVRWVSNAGSGCNHLMPWDPEQVIVTNSAGVAAEAMANFALGAILYFALDVPGLVADQRARRWQVRSVRPLTGATLVVVGVGKTGQMAARQASAIGMRVRGVRANPQPTEGIECLFPPEALADALTGADYVLVCLPLTDRTRGMLDEAALARIGPGAVLVDLSRGGIVDHGAMVAALDDGRLRGAALDVFPTEPLPAESGLWARRDVLISPHCSGVCDGWEARSVEMFAENLTRWQAGWPLENIVDPTRGY